MRGIKFIGYQKILGAPVNWNPETDGPCTGLPVSVSDDNKVVFSCWKFDLRERLKILFGSNIMLAVWSGQATQSPVSLYICDHKEID